MGLTADHTGWSGRGQIVLTIPEKKDAHYLVIIPITFCKKIDVEESKYDTGPQNVRIEVSDTVITTTDSQEISAEVSVGPAKVSGKWTGSVSKSSTGVYSYPTGIEASLTVGFWLHVGGVESQLDKSADVSGNLGPAIAPDSIYASFPGEDHDYCWAF